MPDGSNSPDAPITVYVDGDIKAFPFIQDLKRAGLRLVNEGGKTFLRKQEERDELPDTITEALDDAKDALSRAEIADALELIERAERLVQENEADKETAANIAFEIAIECSHLIASINLLLAGIEGEQIKVAEYDIRSGTVVNGLYGLEWGVDRIQRLAEKVK